MPLLLLKYERNSENAEMRAMKTLKSPEDTFFRV